MGSPGDDEDIIKPQPTFVRSVTRLLMAIRGINVRYTINESTTLPGFMPGSGILGMSAADGSAPGFGFVTGSQDYDVLTRAAANGWLTSDLGANLAIPKPQRILPEILNVDEDYQDDLSVNVYWLNLFYRQKRLVIDTLEVG